MGALSRLVGRVDRRSRCRSARLSACRHGQSLDRGRGGMAAVRLCGSSRTGGALGNTTRYDGARGMSMTLNIDAIRREVRALDYRSEEHTSELQSLMRISYAVFCLKKKNKHTT